MESENSLLIQTDGGARGNPGPAAIGIVIRNRNKLLVQHGEKIGVATNNVAEYSAVLWALRWLVENVAPDIKKIHFFLDSLLVVQQLNGVFKIKNEKLRELLFAIRGEEARITVPIIYSHIRREQNTEADSMVNKALDNLL